MTLFFVNCADESDTETFGFNSLGNSGAYAGPHLQTGLFILFFGSISILFHPVPMFLSYLLSKPFSIMHLGIP